MKVIFHARATEDYEFFKKHDLQIANKIAALIENMQQTPYSGLGKPEAMRFELSGFWSRRITKEHRILYRVENGELVVYQCRFHYFDD